MIWGTCVVIVYPVGDAMLTVLCVKGDHFAMFTAALTGPPGSDLLYISTTSLHSGIGDRASCTCSAHYSNYLIFIVTVSSCLHLSIQCLSVVFHVLGYVGNMYITCGDCDHIAVGIAVYLSLNLLNYCVSTIYMWLYLRCCFCCVPPPPHTHMHKHSRAESRD